MRLRAVPLRTRGCGQLPKNEGDKTMLPALLDEKPPRLYGRAGTGLRAITPTRRYQPGLPSSHEEFAAERPGSVSDSYFFLDFAAGLAVLAGVALAAAFFGAFSAKRADFPSSVWAMASALFARSQENSERPKWP